MFLTALAQWAFFIAALVYAFDRGGARATGFASVALLVPIALVAPRAGKAAQSRRPDRVRLASYSVQALTLSSAAVAAFAEAPVAVVVGCCGIAAGAFTFLAPAGAVLLPAIVRSALELTTANVWIGSCESVSMLGGSALATLLLAVEGPALVLAGCAGLTLVSMLITASPGSTITGWSAPSRADATESVGATRLVFRNIRAMSTRPGTSGVLAIAGGQYVLVGSLDLIVVVLAHDALDLGESGPGLLSTSIGVGALILVVPSAVVTHGEPRPF